MSNKNKNFIFLDNLAEALGSSEGQTPEEIKKDLREDGVDVDTTMSRLMNNVHNISMEAKRQRLDTVREARLETAKDRTLIVNKFKGWSKSEMLSRIKESISLVGGDVSFAYRDLKVHSTEEVRAMLEDLELAKIKKEQNQSNDE